MNNYCLIVLFVINFFQDSNASKHLAFPHSIYKRSPQQIDIQSISQRQISPDITVVDVVVNEPVRKTSNNRNQYIQPIHQPEIYNQNNYNQLHRQNFPNGRQPEIQIIKIVDLNPGRAEIQQGNPWQNQAYPERSPPGQREMNRPYSNRRPHRPNADFHIEDEEFNRPRPDMENPNRRRRPKPHRKQEFSEEEKYIFDAAETAITDYTKDSFPIIPLNKNEIRK